MKIKILILSIVVVILGLFVVNAYSHYRDFYNEEDVKVDVKKIDKGIQITITSDDPDVVKDIQENVKWYKNIFKHVEKYNMYDNCELHWRNHGCMW